MRCFMTKNSFVAGVTFKITINWNKCLAQKSTERWNPYLDYLIGPSFQGVNRFFIFLLENENDRKAHRGHYLPKVIYDQWTKILWKTNKKWSKNIR